MAEIAHDALYTNVEITKRIYHNGKIILDFLDTKGSTLYVDRIVTSNVTGYDIGGVREISGNPVASVSELPSSSFTLPYEDQDELLKLKGDRNIQKAKSLAIGGELNESSGENATTIGGSFNESIGDMSVTVGGCENKAYGINSVAMGKNALSNHNTSFVYNTAEDELESTMDKQFMVGSDNGLFFKLPKSNDISTHHVPEGFACWCWDSTLKTVIMKTKQDDIMYKTIVPTSDDELKVHIDPISGLANLYNPDLH